MRPNKIIENILSVIKSLIPKRALSKIRPAYHWSLAFSSNIMYGAPSKEIKIVAVTGTKGKTSVTEMIHSILETAGYKTALLNTYRFKDGEKEVRNMFKMSTPGRGFVQKFLQKAVRNKCDWVVMELTSQAVLTYRHSYIHLDALVFTNISPEHIEAHGSFENYLEAKLKIADLLEKSEKSEKYIISNVDDKNGNLFLDRVSCNKVPYSIEDAKPYIARDDGVMFTFDGARVTSGLPGVFNVYNMLASAVFAKSVGVKSENIKKGLEGMEGIRGRLEKVGSSTNFDVYVDYAHTSDSLEQVYSIFRDRPIIAILGNTGGGRDTWKRSVMAGVAEKYCSHIILTNEDPYDEDPLSIVKEMYESISKKEKAEIILDRRDAIREALQKAEDFSGEEKPVVLITGKGTDPYIMGKNGSKIPWDDAEVVREELSKLK